MKMIKGHSIVIGLFFLNSSTVLPSDREWNTFIEEAKNTLQTISDLTKQAQDDAATEKIKIMETKSQEVQNLLSQQPTTGIINATLSKNIMELFSNQKQLLNTLFKQEKKLDIAKNHISKIKAQLQSLQKTIPNINNESEIPNLIKQMETQKDVIANIATISATLHIKQGVAQVKYALDVLQQITKKFVRLPGIDQDTKTAYTLAEQLITHYQSIEKSLHRLVKQQKYEQAFQAAVLLKTSLKHLLPITALTKNNVARMATVAQEVAELLAPATSVASELTPGSTSGAAPTQTRTPSYPTMQAPGKANEAINKLNNKMRSAISRLDRINGYYSSISKDERTLIKSKVESIAKEYLATFTEFAQKIKQVKQDGATLNTDKLTPFNTFLDLYNQLQNKIKSL